MDCAHTPIEQMQEFLGLQVEEVRNHVTVVSTTDVGQDYFLRIDKNVPDKFIPNMPRTAMKSENTTCARVTVAPTLLGCLIGYFRAERDLVEAGFEKPGKESFRGGYEISRIPFDLALAPDEELVPDVGRSNEHWLVGYNKEHVEYSSETVGKCFIAEMTYLNTGANLPAMKLSFWIESLMEGLDLRGDLKLAKGYHIVDIFWKNMHKRDVRDLTCITEVRSVSQVEFMTKKGLCAELLSYAEAPRWMSWK